MAAPKGVRPVSRRTLLGVAGAAVAAGAFARGRFFAGGDALAAPIEILVVDAPLGQDFQPPILGRAELRTTGQAGATTLDGTIPAHRFRVAAEQTEAFLRLRVEIELHGRPRRTLVADLDPALAVRRLWVGRRYLHVDHGDPMDTKGTFPDQDGGVLARYPVSPAEPYRDAVAMARRGEGQEIAEHRFDYRYDTVDGLIGLDLPDGGRFLFDWASAADGDASRWYRTLWTRGEHVVLRLEERVFPNDQDAGPFGAMPVTVGVDGARDALYVARPAVPPCCGL